MSSQYKNYTNEQLKSLLREQKLKVSGRKSDLIKRLQTGVNVGSTYERKAYRSVPKKDFCGKAGNAAPRSFPVNTESRCRAALSYARNAPNPEGIRKCAMEKARQHPNWRCGVASPFTSPRGYVRPSRTSPRRARSASPRRSD